MSLRIALVCEVFAPKIDGVVVRTMNLIQQLLASGDEIMVLCPAMPGRQKMEFPVVEFASFPFSPYPEYHIGLPDHDLISSLRQFAPDVVHYINPFAFGFRCHDLLSRAGFDYPTVYSFHTLYGEFAKQYRLLKPLSKVLWWLTREYHNSAGINLTVSQSMLDELAVRGFERLHLWIPAVDTDRYSPTYASAAMRDRLTRGRPERKLLLSVSRLAVEKNVSFLREVLCRCPDITLAIVGDGPYRANLEHQFAGLDVNFMGYFQGQDLVEAYATADAFIYASETETMGNVVLEAMASGQCVIAPHALGVRSLIEHNVNGLLYEPRNAAAALACVSQAFQDEAIRQSLKQRAREYAVEHTWCRSARQVRETYLSCIAQSGLEKRQRKRLARVLTSGLVQSFRAGSAAKNGFKTARPNHKKPVTKPKVDQELVKS